MRPPWPPQPATATCPPLRPPVLPLGCPCPAPCLSLRYVRPRTTTPTPVWVLPIGIYNCWSLSIKKKKKPSSISHPPPATIPSLTTQVCSQAVFFLHLPLVPQPILKRVLLCPSLHYRTALTTAGKGFEYKRRVSHPFPSDCEDLLLPPRHTLPCHPVP